MTTHITHTRVNQHLDYDLLKEPPLMADTTTPTLPPTANKKAALHYRHPHLDWRNAHQVNCAFKRASREAQRDGFAYCENDYTRAYNMYRAWLLIFTKGDQRYADAFAEAFETVTADQLPASRRGDFESTVEWYAKEYSKSDLLHLFTSDDDYRNDDTDV